MDCHLTAQQIIVLVFAHLLLLASVKTQERIEMKCNPSLRHRYEDCPAGYCCVRDEFLPTFVYCRKFGAKDDNCTTKDTDSECPCDAGLMCLANIQGKYPSVYGRCVVNATTLATTTTTTVTTEKVVTSDPVSVNMTTIIANGIISEDGNTTANTMVTSDADFTKDMKTTGDNIRTTQEPTTEKPMLNTTTDSNSLDNKNNDSVTVET